LTDTDPNNGPPQLTIDTNRPAQEVSISPIDVDISSSSLPRINKLDLHPTVEDDTSSDTSSAAPSKPPSELHPSLSNLFSPRNSLDVRDSDREGFISIRNASDVRRLPPSPLARVADDYAENLMMGYAQVTGSFMIDEALIHASEFEDVKNKSVVGGKSGGGVVGLDSRRPGTWTGLNLNFGGLFGAVQRSSLAEMRDRASSKVIPILGTPPAILFVDIKLKPGESKSFKYSFRLPRNLPPSHRGRAIRITYSIIVTTQRPGQGQQLSTCEIPFRVFQNLDGIYRNGGTDVEYGHQGIYNLKSPIIILRDQAKTSTLTRDTTDIPRQRSVRRSSTYSDKPIESSEEEFLQFVDKLLSSLGRPPPAADSHLQISTPRSPCLTPTKERFRRLSCREAIDVALLRGTTGKAKIGVFEIGKNGVNVVKLTLPRTTYKLGETVEGVLDFVNGPIRCYQVRLFWVGTDDRWARCWNLRRRWIRRLV
jgi:RAB6A-GEF complex partner protein 2